VFEMLRCVSTSYYTSPLIYTNSASCSLPHVRSSDLLIFALSRAAVPPLDAVQFGKMLRPSVRPLDVATFSFTSYRPLHEQSFVWFCFNLVNFILERFNVSLFIVNFQ
jgi:hypothetical protein